VLSEAQRAELAGKYGGGVVVSLQGPSIDWRTPVLHSELIPRGGDFFMIASTGGLVRALRGDDGKVEALTDVDANLVRRREN
jgi:hypothetical protein